MSFKVEAAEEVECNGVEVLIAASLTESLTVIVAKFPLTVLLSIISSIIIMLSSVSETDEIGSLRNSLLSACSLLFYA